MQMDVDGLGKMAHNWGCLKNKITNYLFKPQSCKRRSRASFHAMRRICGIYFPCLTIVGRECLIPHGILSIGFVPDKSDNDILAFVFVLAKKDADVSIERSYDRRIHHTYITI